MGRPAPWANGVEARGAWRRDEYAWLLEALEHMYKNRLDGDGDGDVITQLLVLLHDDIIELEAFVHNVQQAALARERQWWMAVAHSRREHAGPARRPERRESHRSRPGHRRRSAQTSGPPDDDGPGEPAAHLLALASVDFGGVS